MQDFRHYLRHEIGLDPLKMVMLGFSGGPDSLCLLHVLIENGYKVIAAHLDHSIRASSAAEAVHVQELCGKLDVQCVSKRVDVVAFSKENHLTLEESARVLRYKFLFEEAERLGCQAVLVGHNADDQVETVLMHLLRGSGLSGLAGMRPVLLPNPWSNTIPIARPLIHITRSEIEDFLEQRGLTAIVDESNTDQQYFRNRIRHELVPYLTTYNPRIRERIQNMATVISTEDDFMRFSLNEVWTKVVLREGDHFLLIDRAALIALHPALQRRFLRRMIEWMAPGIRDIEFDLINRAVDFCRNPTRSNRIDLLAGLELFLFDKNLVIAYETDPLHDLWPQLEARESFEIPVPGDVRISSKWSLHISRQSDFSIDPSLFTAQIDAAKVTGPLVLDRVRPGDRFAPYGYNGHTKKVGDFWTSEGLPARARKNWPLLKMGEEIIWIPGFRIAERVRVEESTREIIRLVMNQ